MRLRPAMSLIGFVVIGCAVLSVGCDSKPYGLATVSGVVTLDGQPLPKAHVKFQPVGAGVQNPGPASLGQCDEAGHYELKTIRDEPGAVVGQHRVEIYSDKPEQDIVRDDSTMDSNVGPLVVEPIPARYNAQTQLTFTVPEDGTTAADFALTTKP